MFYLFCVDFYSQRQHQQQMTRTCRRSVYLWPAKIPTKLNETNVFSLDEARTSESDRERERESRRSSRGSGRAAAEAEAAQMSFELQRQPKIACARCSVVVVVVQHIF